MEADSDPGGEPRLISVDTAPTPVAAGRTRWWIHLALIAAYVLWPAVVGWSRHDTRAPALSSSGGRLLLVCAVQLAIFGLVLGLACIASRASRDDLLLRWRGRLWPVPLGIGYSVALRFSLAFVVVTLGVALVATRAMTPDSLLRLVATDRPNVEAIVDVAAMRNDPLYYWLTLTLVSFVVAGLREELWRAAFLAGLRRLWPRRFGSRAGQVGAVTIAAVLFGLGHVPMGPMAVCAAGILGFGLGLIMVLHRSIWPAVIAHGTFDATSLALIPWALERLRQAQQMLGH